MNATTNTTGGGCRCGRCKRVLKNPQAVEIGYGAVCFRKMFGGSFPGKKKNAAAPAVGAGHSDFDCHMRTVNNHSVMVITDLDAGGMSVTNNIRAVVQEAAARLGVTQCDAIIYRDSTGTYDGVRASIGSGETGFYHLGQQTEEAAITAALAARGSRV